MILLSELVETDSQASVDAKQLNLTHVGWGRYADQAGKITHVSKDGKLVPIQATGLRPRKIKGPITPVPEDPTEGGSIIPVNSVPTKRNPTDEEKHIAAKNHKFVIQSSRPIQRINFNKKEYIHHDDYKKYHKPIGIWYALGSQWVDFSNREFASGWGSYLYSLDINSEKMLIIDSIEKLKEFNKKYGIWKDMGPFKMRRIDWPRVREDYSGIQIYNPNDDNEFFHEVRHYNDEMWGWYKGWDVGSGCIWDASAINSVNQIPIE